VDRGIAPRGQKKVPIGKRKIDRSKEAKVASGLNENYGRELLELHTLSVTADTL